MSQHWDIKPHETILVYHYRVSFITNIYAEIKFITFIALSSYPTTPANFPFVTTDNAIQWNRQII